MVVKRTRQRRKRIWSAILAGIFVGALLSVGWHFGNGYLQPVTIAMPDVFIPQVQSTPTAQPTDAEFAAMLRTELENQRRTNNGRAIVSAPPQADPPEPDAPPLPIATPTPIADTKIRPLPWPYTPAPARPERIYARHVGLDAEIIPVGYSIRETNGVLVRIYEVARWAAGWHTNSSLPGWQGNTVLAGHQNAWGNAFRPALNLEPGDFLFVEAGGITYSYLVVIKEIMPETNAEERYANGRWIAQTEDERLTLVTCWPPDGNSHRMVIVAIPAK
jgi:LPXTG-site transpeptidase (sortase) family protein